MPQARDSAQRTLRVSVPTMTCRHCVRTVSRHLHDVPGVESVAAQAAGTIVVLRGTMVAADVLSALAACGSPGRLDP